MQDKRGKALQITAKIAENTKMIDIIRKTQYNHDKFLNAL